MPLKTAPDSLMTTTLFPKGHISAYPPNTRISPSEYYHDTFERQPVSFISIGCPQKEESLKKVLLVISEKQFRKADQSDALGYFFYLFLQILTKQWYQTGLGKLNTTVSSLSHSDFTWTNQAFTKRFKGSNMSLTAYSQSPLSEPQETSYKAVTQRRRALQWASQDYVSKSQMHRLQPFSFQNDSYSIWWYKQVWGQTFSGIYSTMQGI